MLKRVIWQHSNCCLFPAKSSWPVRPGYALRQHKHHIHSLVKGWDTYRHRCKRAALSHRQQSSRSLTTGVVPPFLVPPLIFIGLLLGLWTWKCFWIIVMQNKLLYLSWLPPFSRSDTISEYELECKPARWQETRIRSLDGTTLAVCEGRVPGFNDEKLPMDAHLRPKMVVICYFQGNGGSTPLRLPLLSQVLNAITMQARSSTGVSYAIVALSYRGYWQSSGRATQSGIELDAQAFLNWVSESHLTRHTDLEIVLWGHSLGSVIATSALSTYLARQQETSTTCGSRLAPISGLIMEAPMSSVKDMLVSLYPQRWLPYRYLWPFSWNTWCHDNALERLAHWRDVTERMQDGLPRTRAPSIPPLLILSADQDEVIPPHVADRLEERGRDLMLDITRQRIPGAMHTEIPIKAKGKNALVKFVLDHTQATGEGC